MLVWVLQLGTTECLKAEVLAIPSILSPLTLTSKNLEQRAEALLLIISTSPHWQAQWAGYPNTTRAAVLKSCSEGKLELLRWMQMCGMDRAVGLRQAVTQLTATQALAALSVGVAAVTR